MNIEPISYRYAPSEGALPLPKSKGKTKERIHLFKYEGDPNKDPYAVAVKKLKSSTPKLNIFEKKFSILHAVKEGAEVTWYKINKNSLKKRLNIQDRELKKVIDAKSGKTSTEFHHLIQKKHTLLQKYKNALDVPFGRTIGENGSVYGPSDGYKIVLPLAERLVEACVQNHIHFPYKKVLFLCVDRGWPGLFHYESYYKQFHFHVGEQENENPYNLKNYNKDEILVVLYDRNEYGKGNGNNKYNPGTSEPEEFREFLKRPDSPLKVVNIDLKSQQQLIKRGELSKKVSVQLQAR